MKPNRNYRLDGRTEWICRHGIGHTITVPEEHYDNPAWWIHGCDGCCKSQDTFDYEILEDERQDRMDDAIIN